MPSPLTGPPTARGRWDPHCTATRPSGSPSSSRLPKALLGAAAGRRGIVRPGLMSESPNSDSPSDSANIVGRMAGEYRLLRKLGEGGFGTVYAAEHPVLKRRAAVKVLHQVAGVDSDAVLRFMSEAQAVNQIQSRHIVDVFSFGRLSDGRHFY